ncbi:MAG: hypothetical protein JW727_00800 [Candidatus Aenigmarchaeota archaeon]|nr:hypothetical protein [Candidatus Aenigmarchaeota archaeon]
MYSNEIKGNTAKACNYNARVSFKNSKFVCRAIKGMDVQKAKKFLEEVLEKKRSINGKYYSSIASEILMLIKSAEKNAEFKNLDLNNIFVAHIASAKGTTMRRRRHKNKIGSKLKAAHLEVILRERPIAGAAKAVSKIPAAPEKAVPATKTEETAKEVEKVKEAVKEKAKTEANAKIETKKEEKAAAEKPKEKKEVAKKTKEAPKADGKAEKKEAARPKEKKEAKPE